MNDLVKFGGASLPANPEELAKGLSNVGANLQANTGGVPFLRLMRTGIFVYGQENIEVEEGSHWAINPYSIQHGFACWGDGELLGESMVPFSQQPPPQNELPDYGEKWGQQVSLQMQCLDGEDTGVNVLYKGTSVGMRNAIKTLIDQIINQAAHDPKHVVPVVTLESDSYKHKKYGDIFYPVLTIDKWISIDSGETNSNDAENGDSPDAIASAPAEEVADTGPKPAEPARRRRRGQPAAGPTVEPEVAEKPAGRRRRRAAS